MHGIVYVPESEALSDPLEAEGRTPTVHVMDRGHIRECQTSSKRLWTVILRDRKSKEGR